MRKLVYCFMVLLFLVNFKETVFAAESAPAKNAAAGSEEKAAEKKSTDKKAKTTSATKTTKPQRPKGEITAMDPKAGTLTVKGTTEEKSFLAQDAAKDFLERLKVGERVRVIYSEKEGKMVTTSVRRMKVKTASSGAQEKKPTQAPAPQTKDGGESKKP